MSYIINTYNGTQLTAIADGTVDTTTNLTLVGKNYAGFGTIQNDNFLYLLENFSNVTAPTKPISGQLWFDSSANKLKLYDKSANWRTISGADVSTVFPNYLTDGDFYFDTINNQLYVYTSASGYILVGPTNNTVKTSFDITSVIDTNNVTHEIISASVAGTTIFTVSKDTVFTLLPTLNPIAGFTDIHPGITLANTTDPLNPGYTIQGFRFYGTSTNTDTINVKNLDGTINKPAVDATINISTNIDKTSVVSRDALGDVYANTFHGIVTEANSLLVGTVYETADAAATNSTIAARDSIGDLYANTFHGIATEANSLLVSGFYYPASINTTLNGTVGSNIAVRDNVGDLYANTFNGVATTAQYADLAEKYLADQVYDVGTVVMVGGINEVTACSLFSRAIGAVSQNPGFMMNKDLENGTYIALKGRVPVKVNGIVKKGDRLVADDNGIAKVKEMQSEEVFAISLESNDDINTKFVEAIIL